MNRKSTWSYFFMFKDNIDKAG